MFPSNQFQNFLPHSHVKSFFIRPLLKMRFANGFEKGSGQTCIQQTRLKINKGWKTTWTQKSTKKSQKGLITWTKTQRRLGPKKAKDETINRFTL
jgi:hypothetical protein